MKIYNAIATWHNGTEKSFGKYRKKKRILGLIENLKINSLIVRIELETTMLGEYEEAGKYEQKRELVFER